MIGCSGSSALVQQVGRVSGRWHGAPAMRHDVQPPGRLVLPAARTARQSAAGLRQRRHPRRSLRRWQVGRHQVSRRRRGSRRPSRGRRPAFAGVTIWSSATFNGTMLDCTRAASTAMTGTTHCARSAWSSQVCVRHSHILTETFSLFSSCRGFYYNI